ncbi:GTP-binding protein [Marinilactibacillus sp. GCM10026970]|uniref:GTP-binding protein n=1 Tax=Marinilactibacillus sp. GCM10026970 TaxID=3252642 RepID=UPI00361F098D
MDNWPRTVTRCKGVVWFVTQPQNVIKLSQSGRAMDIIPSGYWIAQLKQWEINKMFEQRTHLKDIWDEDYGDRMIELVFIGKGMNREKIIAELDQCLVARGESVQVLRDPFLMEEA